MSASSSEPSSDPSSEPSSEPSANAHHVSRTLISEQTERWFSFSAFEMNANAYGSSTAAIKYSFGITGLGATVLDGKLPS